MISDFKQAKFTKKNDTMPNACPPCDRKIRSPGLLFYAAGPTFGGERLKEPRGPQPGEAEARI